MRIEAIRGCIVVILIGARAVSSRVASWYSIGDFPRKPWTLPSMLPQPMFSAVRRCWSVEYGRQLLVGRGPLRAVGIVRSWYVRTKSVELELAAVLAQTCQYRNVPKGYPCIKLSNSRPIARVPPRTSRWMRGDQVWRWIWSSVFLMVCRSWYTSNLVCPSDRRAT